MSAEPVTGDPARGRFFVLTAIRLAGAGFVALGAANIGKHWIEPADTVGTTLLGVGAVLILLVPQLLARRWRSGGNGA